jgi:hypothetical protein
LRGKAFSAGPTSILDGLGEYWWQYGKHGKLAPTMNATRPHLIQFMRSSDIEVREKTPTSLFLSLSPLRIMIIIVMKNGDLPRQARDKPKEYTCNK